MYPNVKIKFVPDGWDTLKPLLKMSWLIVEKGPSWRFLKPDAVAEEEMKRENMTRQTHLRVTTCAGRHQLIFGFCGQGKNSGKSEPAFCSCH